MIHFLFKSGEDAPQWEEGAGGGGVKTQPGGSLAWLNLQPTWTWSLFEYKMRNETISSQFDKESGLDCDINLSVPCLLS